MVSIFVSIIYFAKNKPMAIMLCLFSSAFFVFLASICFYFYFTSPKLLLSVRFPSTTKELKIYYVMRSGNVLFDLAGIGKLKYQIKENNKMIKEDFIPLASGYDCYQDVKLKYSYNGSVIEIKSGKASGRVWSFSENGLLPADTKVEQRQSVE
jgi:hypothetical protein